MRRLRLTITLKESTVLDVDKLIDGQKLRNRSHAIEYILNQNLNQKVYKAIILAGGRGTKLRPYTLETPKSLLLIKGQPIIKYLIENLKKSGVTDIMICVGHLGNKIKDYLKDGKEFGVKISYSEEKKPLGTGGAISKIKDFIDDKPFLVLHGDILIDLNLKDLLEYHSEQGGSIIGTIALSQVNNSSMWGQFRMHGTKIVNFIDKTKKGEEESHLINTGVYVFEKKIFDYFPTGQKTFLLEDIIKNLIKDRKITGFVFEGQWFDVGTPETYEEAIKSFLLKSST